VDSFEIFPAKEIILDEQLMKKGVEAIQNELDSIIRNKTKRKGYDKEALEKLKSHTASNLEYLKEGMFFDNMDAFLPYFFDAPSTFFDFIGKGKIIIDDTANSLG